MNLNRPLSSGDAVCPSIDKPWMKYYDEEAKVSAIPPIGLYEYLRQCIEAFPSSAFCLNYYGNRISYRDLLGSIDKVAKAFLGIGIKKGDIFIRSRKNSSPFSFIENRSPVFTHVLPFSSVSSSCSVAAGFP